MMAHHDVTEGALCSWNMSCPSRRRVSQGHTTESLCSFFAVQNKSTKIETSKRQCRLTRGECLLLVENSFLCSLKWWNFLSFCFPFNSARFFMMYKNLSSRSLFKFSPILKFFLFQIFSFSVNFTQRNFVDPKKTEWRLEMFWMIFFDFSLIQFYNFFQKFHCVFCIEIWHFPYRL